MEFVELKVKTNHSFLEGGSRPAELVEQAHRLGYQAMGICDRNGVYGFPQAHRTTQEFPLKLIVGSEITIESAPSLCFYARTRAAYGLLCRLITRAHHGKEKGAAALAPADLWSHLETHSAATQDLIVLIRPQLNAQPGQGPISYEMLKDFLARVHTCKYLDIFLGSRPNTKSAYLNFKKNTIFACWRQTTCFITSLNGVVCKIY